MSSERYYSRKPRLPKGHSYTIKRSEFDSFLEQERIADVTGLSYRSLNSQAVIFRAMDYGRGDGIGVHFYAVLSRHRRVVVNALNEKVLPAFAGWTRRYNDKTLLLAQLPHHLEASYAVDDESGAVEISFLEWSR